MMKFQQCRRTEKNKLGAARGMFLLKRFTISSYGIFVYGLIFLTISVYHVSLKNGKEERIPFLDGGHVVTRRRIAIIIPFLSTSLVTVPSYFPIFLQTARGSASIIDFLVFHNGQLVPLIDDAKSTIQGFEIPRNVKFINLESMQNFTSHFMRVIDQRLQHNYLDKEEMDNLSEMISILLQKSPYILVEYKPAMGHIFQDYILDYSHWGYSDFDIVFGDLPRWITDEELNDWDIVTYSYGDQDRVYLRGQFTFHKNKESINHIWRKCTHLSEMDQRYKRVLLGGEKLRLVSAEGCYSNAVINTKNISVKYVVKAMSDVKDRNDDSFELGITIASGTQNDKTVIYKAPKGPLDLKRFQGLSYTWFENDALYNTRDLQYEQGPKHLITEQHKQRPGCMYWVKRDYQMDLCYDGISSTDTVMLVNGQLFKQSFKEQQFPHGVVSKAFFHFQDWKRSFTSDQLAAFHRKLMSGHRHLGWQLFQEGAVEVVEMSSRMQETTDALTSKNKQNLPPHYYCLSSVYKTTHSAIECDYAISWRDENVFLNISEDWHDVKESDVTLILTMKVGLTVDGQGDALSSVEPDSDDVELESLLQHMESNIASWHDSPVLILVYSSLSVTLHQYLQTRMDEMLPRRSKLFVAVIHGEQSDKKITTMALNNMAESACRTRWFLSGIDVNQGIVISQESLLFCNKAIRSYAEQEPNVVFVLGQMMRSKGRNHNDSIQKRFPPLPYYSFLDIVSQLHPIQGNDIQTQIHQLWMTMSMDEIDPRDRSNPNYVISLAKELHNLQVVLSFALAEEHSNFLHFSKPPILLLNSKGSLGFLPPQVIEERWQQCSSGLRLARLALMGNAIIPLPGAFVVYTSGKNQDLSYHSNLGAKCKSLSSSSTTIKNSIIHTAKLTTLRDLGSNSSSPYLYVG